MIDYEQKYKDALSKIKGYVLDDTGCTCLKPSDIFPELQESDDEMIRKELLEHCKNQAKPYIETGNKCPQIQSWIAWLEKQGEQKAANESEPKFKVTDWVVDNCGCVWRIEGILNKFYILEGIDGCKSRPTIEWVNKTFHLWDITKDANDGDVLSFKDDKECPFLYKGCLDPDHPNSPVAYGGICSGGKFIPGGKKFNNWWTDKKVYPATKEQRDTLMKAMDDAGYEFDFDKKELKKTNSYCQENCKGYQETGKCFADGDCKAKIEAEQNSALSEKYEKIGKELIEFCEKCSQGQTVINSQNDFTRWTDWLKSIKERLQSQNTWKPSDEQMRCLCGVLNNSTGNIYNILKSLFDDLKKLNTITYFQDIFLKERYYAWKPSDEQIEAIRLARSFVTDDFDDNPALSETLIELEQQLKKLKED